MARSKQNMLLFGFSGRVGNMVIKQYKDKTVLSALPDMSGRILSEKQKQYNRFMSAANKYAKMIMADPVLKEEACKKLLLQPNKLFRVLVKEYMKRKGEVNDFIPMPQQV